MIWLYDLRTLQVDTLVIDNQHALFPVYPILL
jgi:hypothetical protein